MYTAFILKEISSITEDDITKNVYIIGPSEEKYIQINVSDITKYCTVDSKDLIRIDTSIQKVAAYAVIDEGYLGSSEEDLSKEYIQQSTQYMWAGDTDEDTITGTYEEWVSAGSPECSTLGPAQIFGGKKIDTITIEEAKELLGENDASIS